MLRRFCELENLQSNNEVAGAKFGAIAAFYSVLLAFIVVVVWNGYTEAASICQQEAADCQILYRLSEGIDPERGEGAPVRAALTDYLRSVIDKEWPLMSTHGFSHDTFAKFNLLSHSIVTAQIRESSASAVNVHRQMLDTLAHLSMARNLRLLSSTTDVPGILWMILVLGAISTIAFASFFGSPNVIAQATMSGTVAMLLALILLAIFLLDNNFSGDLGIRPTALNEILSVIQTAEADARAKAEQAPAAIPSAERARPLSPSASAPSTTGTPPAPASVSP
jgi:hypothetical protein